MAYKFNSDMSFASSIFTLSISIGALFFSEPLLYCSTQNPENSIVHLLIRLLFFILVPVTFLFSIGLLILRAAVPFDSPLDEFYADRINWMTKIMALTTLLVGLGIGVYLVFPDAVAAWWFVD